MLDMKRIEENSNYVKENLEKRGFDVSIIDQIIKLNEERKKNIKKVEEFRSNINALSKQIGMKMKNKEDASELKERVGEAKSSMSSIEELLNKVEGEQKELMQVIPNLLEEAVPVGKDETQNVEILKEGAPANFNFTIKDHVDLGESLGMLSFDEAAKLTGSRFAILKGGLARLERALINYMIDFHLERGYLEVQPPFIVNSETLFGTGQLPKFEEDLFKLEDTDWYLIPTAEVPLTNLKKKTIMSKDEMPLKYCAFTPCFRSEAGSYGKDTRGLIRLHQFNKVEMVNIVSPEDSPAAHQEMIDSACDILRALKLPFRAVRLCSGDVGFSSQNTVDLEVWLPSQNTYREISSISNCGDFQARRANIRFRDGQKGRPQFAHTLNGSGLAVGRTLLAIMENYQQDDGSILIPEVLRAYMGSQELLK